MSRGSGRGVAAGHGGPAGLVRAFLAFDVPSAIKDRLRVSMGEIRGRLPAARWVRPQGVHVTVKFLGASKPERLDELVQALEPEVTGLAPVTFTLGEVGFFPSPARARVAWIGGTAHGARPIVTAVEEVAVRMGWPADRRPWSLHLTLARLKSPWPPQAVDRFLQWGERLAFEPFRCSELVLYSSVLQPSGAVYTRLAAMPLDGDAMPDGRP